MGGAGSGRRSWKDTVEECQGLDMTFLVKEKIIGECVRRTGLLKWTRNGETTSTMGCETNTLRDDYAPHDPARPWFRVFYRMTCSGEAFDYKIRLKTTRPYFGGLRWWFTCALVVNGRACGRRARKLYRKGAYFGCRHCLGLTYESCKASHKLDFFLVPLAQKLGLPLREAKRAFREQM
jgi:hypothetical protein